MPSDLDLSLGTAHRHPVGEPSPWSPWAHAVLSVPMAPLSAPPASWTLTPAATAAGVKHTADCTAWSEVPHGSSLPPDHIHLPYWGTQGFAPNLQRDLMCTPDATDSGPPPVLPHAPLSPPLTTSQLCSGPLPQKATVPTPGRLCPLQAHASQGPLWVSLTHSWLSPCPHLRAF